ncbi:enhanced serine sensitivity protein SseB C-terminal domain-containing protein [Longimicrobium terrae]|uniref:SseB protein N-terminal domain-containing protein n=1 Tax=Longimicrobium terrae TaxID=1639882 RepID=A0A841H337_9BACT|nr:enhanced serine sensitivity protein SseB C-terminal domain-containing protein [Longimicrobium terrae]MBB4637809.1 hypothetical protein [Longimicrobium terrae]MBB6072336.1 hypothetical protein [Longimicrobium terrae]NNC31255.1 hypothetical protein [Longimicrobium terrae]
MSEAVDVLDQALARAIADPEHWAEFYQTFVESAVYVLGEPTPETSGFSLIHLEDEEGDVVPVFSSPAKAEAIATEELQCVPVPALALLSQLRGGRVVLNPGAPAYKLFTAMEIEALLEGVDESAGGILVEEPDALPADLTDPLARLFATHPDVSAAYLVQVTPPGAESRLVIGIDAVNDADRVREEASVLVDTLRAGREVDVMVMEEDPLSVHLRAEVEPFFGDSLASDIDPERLRRLDANPPKWGDSLLGRMTGKAEAHTQISMGAIVQANTALWAPADEPVTAPAVLVYSASPERRMDRRWVRHLARRLNRLRVEDPADPVEQRLRDRLEAEDDWFFEPLPAAFTGDSATFWCVVALSSTDLPGGSLPGDGVLPLLTCSPAAKKPGELLQVVPKAEWARPGL